MAKTTILGKAVVITSSLKMEDIETVKKYRPEALLLKGGEDGKEIEFFMATGRMGEVTDFGICFTNATPEGKFASLTQVIDYDGDNVKEKVADLIGGALVKLNKLEATLPAVIEEINAEKETVLASITVAE